MQPSLLQILMPPLQEKWASIPDTDRELQPLFECFTSLATALGLLPLHSLPRMELPQAYSGEDAFSSNAIKTTF